jgi:hypothetical protein
MWFKNRKTVDARGFFFGFLSCISSEVVVSLLIGLAVYYDILKHLLLVYCTLGISTV